jgi:hypothetical protein
LKGSLFRIQPRIQRAIGRAEMINLITSIQWKEVPREEIAHPEEAAPWRSRQLLRAFYYNLELEGMEEIPTKKRETFKLTIVAAKWRTADVAG